MAKKDPRVDAYISKLPEFSRAILTESRARIHAACPDVEETIKWLVPFFLYEGKLLASLAAFKAHTKVGVFTAGKPEFVDAKAVADLLPAKQFAQKIKDSVANLGGAKASKPTAKAPAKASTKKSIAKPAKKKSTKAAAKSSKSPKKKSAK